jgi:GT2 family glycosyltransferase
MTARISIVIPNWNGLEHLPTCLRSISAQTLRPDEVIVVDNGSTDGSQEYIRTNFPGVTIISIQNNRGFVAAVNCGIEAARGTLIALLNNDTELDPRWLEEFVDGLESDPSNGSAACKMLQFDHRATIDAAGDIMSRGCMPVTRGSGEPDDGRYDVGELVFGTCAGAGLYRTSMFQSLGTFDESFVSYYEDVDFAMRAQLAGFPCIYVPKAVCYHKRGATSRRLPGYPERMQERNLTALHLKNLPWNMLLLTAPVILAARTRRIVREILGGGGKAALAGLIEGLALIPSILKRRRMIQRTVVLRLHEIRAVLRTGRR